MRGITWVELNGIWYGVLARAGQRIPEGQPNYGVTAYEITPGYGDDDSAWGVSDRIGGGGLRQRAQSLTVAKGMCSMWFSEFLEARGLVSQVDLDYNLVLGAVAGYWQDVGTLCEVIGGDITFGRVFDALCLLMEDDKVELKDGGVNRAPTYRAALK